MNLSLNQHDFSRGGIAVRTVNDKELKKDDERNQVCGKVLA